jgi:hypothetical protein
MMRKSLVPIALVELCWLLSPDPDTHQADRSVRASDCAGSLVSPFEEEERKGRIEGPFSLSFGDRGGITMSHGRECMSTPRHESQRRQETLKGKSKRSNNTRKMHK